MANSVAQKLKISEKTKLLTINAPADFRNGLHGLPKTASIVTSGRDFDQVHWFVMNRAQLEREMSKVMKLIKDNVIVWIYYPKGTSKLQTDLTRDKGWDCLMAESDKLTWINLISFNDTWSVFGFRAKTAADLKKHEKPRVEREVFKWINPATKEVRIPDDVAAAFKKHSKAGSFFHSLSFTNKKEYLEWILTAKREQTRKERITESIERLAKGWKNPRNV